jgi:malate/lactate dehydrogenase
MISCDDTITTSDGHKGIVIGTHGDMIAVLWFSRHVSKIHRKDIFSYEKFTWTPYANLA